jgi:hypothetical protein
MKYFGLIIFVIASILFVSCEKEDSVGKKSIDSKKENFCGDFHSDNKGNLKIFNQTEDTIHVFIEDKYQRSIVNSDDVLLSITQDLHNKKELKIYKHKCDFDFENPISNIFKKLTVVLDEKMDSLNWTKCYISSSEQSSMGVLTFSYPSKDIYNREVIYNVDVYLGSEAGAHITSLSPGIEGRKVGIEFGTHILYYKYWIEEDYGNYIGVLSSKTPVVLNTQYDNREINIPLYYGSETGRVGILNIKNSLSEILTIKANNKYINDVVVNTGSTNGLEKLQPGDNTNYPLDQKAYIIEVLNSGNSKIMSFENIYPIDSDTAFLVIKQNESYSEVMVKNLTNSPLVIYNFKDWEYLGYCISSGKEQKIKFCLTDQISAFKLGDSLKVSIMNQTENEWSIEEGSFVDVLEVKNIVYLKTKEVFNVTPSSALSGGVFLNNSELSILHKGICWSTNQIPSLEYSHSKNGNGYDEYLSSIQGLNTKTKYFVCAYAITSTDTIWGNIVSFVTK